MCTYDELRRVQQKGVLAELIRAEKYDKTRPLLSIGKRQIGAERDVFVRELIAELVEGGHVTLRDNIKRAIDACIARA